MAVDQSGNGNLGGDNHGEVLGGTVGGTVGDTVGMVEPALPMKQRIFSKKTDKNQECDTTNLV